MNAMERIQKAIRLEIPDRIPVVPNTLFFLAKYAGISMEEYLFDFQKANYAAEKTFKDFGGWDAWYVYPLIDGRQMFLSPVKYKLPGRELHSDEIYQADEKELMKPEDYQIIKEKGYKIFYQELLKRSHPDISTEDFQEIRANLKKHRSEFIKSWEARGVPTLCGLFASMPFDELSYLRSMAEFNEDLFERSEDVIDALKSATPVITEVVKRNAATSGALGVWVSGQRGSAAFVSIEMFKKFVFPYLMQMVTKLIESNILVILHFEQNWIKNLEYLKVLPPGKCVLALDGETDIFKAKKIIGSHICLYGDVPANLLTLGTPEEIKDYCKKLIDEVGDGGAFILGSGSEVPVNSKPENIRAMLQTAKEYGKY